MRCKRWSRLRNSYLRASLGLAALFVLTPVLATDSPDVTIHAVLEGSRLGHGSGNGDVAAETIRIKGNKLRVDFDAGEGRRGRILRSDSGHAWLLMSNSNRALPAGHVPIASTTRLDPQRPCWEPNLSCEKVEVRQVAGRQAQGWRYRHAGHRGPGGTDNGVFWVDVQYGFLLSYKGKDLTGKARRMEATAVQFAPLSDTEFAFPESVRTDIEKADARAARLRGGK
jgi:hypothetical protein